MSNIATAWEGDDAKNTSIDLLDLSVRAYNLLKRSGINTVEQLLVLRQRDLFHIRNFTPQNYEEIRRQLIAHGFMKPALPIGPFIDENDELLQIPWQQVHIFCASEKLLTVVHAFLKQFEGQQDRVRIGEQTFTYKQQVGFIVIEWREEVDNDFLGQLIDDNTIIDFCIYRTFPSI